MVCQSWVLTLCLLSRIALRIIDGKNNIIYMTKRRDKETHFIYYNNNWFYEMFRSAHNMGK